MTMPGGGDNNRQAQVTVSANVDPFAKSMNVASKAAAAFGDALKKLDAGIFAVVKRGGMLAMGGGGLALFGDIKDLQKAAAYQTQLAQLGVQSGKTGKDLQTLGSGVSNLSKTVPMSTQALMGLTTQLASVGVNGTKQLATLTEQASKLAAATNTAPGQLTSGLVELSRTMDTSLQSTSRYGDVLTTLQQQMGASAAGTMNFVAGISAVGAKAGVGEASLLGFGAAFQKLGIDSTSGAQAFNVIMNDMTDAVSRGTTRMQLYANTVGMSADAFKQMFQDDPSKAMTTFVDAIAAQGQRGGQILDQFGLDGSRMIKIFAALTSGSANLKGALAEANNAFAEGNATAKASAQAWDTYNAKVQLMENGFTRLQETIGAGFIPVASKAMEITGTLSNTLANLAEYANAIKLPIVGDWASRWAATAAGVGLAAGAFAVMALNITKVLGLWRVLTGVIGGSALRGMRDGLMRARVPLQAGGVGGARYVARDMEEMSGASRTQLALYRGGYGFGRGVKTTGPLVNDEAGRIGSRGLVRGVVGGTAMLPFTRARQIFTQAKDTALHPIDWRNRDQRATDPFSTYGGYQAMVRGGANVREQAVRHFLRDGASDNERRMGERLKSGFGDMEDSAARLRFDRERLRTSTWNKTHNAQAQINEGLSRPDAEALLHQTQINQMALGEDKSGVVRDFSKYSRRDLNRALKSQAVYTADNASRDATKQFDAKLDEKDQAKLANPFEKLATKIKEISKSITTDSASVMKELMSGLQSFFTKAVQAVGAAAQRMYAEIVKLKALATGATPAEAAKAAEAFMPINAMPAPGAPGGAPKPAAAVPPAPTGSTTDTSRLPNYMVPRAYKGIDPEAVMRGHVSDTTRINDSEDNLRQSREQTPGWGHRTVARLQANAMPNLSQNLERLNAAVVGGRASLLEFGKSTGTLIRSIASPANAMQFAMWGGVAVAALSAFSKATQQTASDAQFAGEEIQKALGREWKSPAQLAAERAQAAGNTADQNPWGATEKKDAASTQFASDHTATLQMLQKIGNAPAAGLDDTQKSWIDKNVLDPVNKAIFDKNPNAVGTSAVLQQQVNALVQQSNGAAVDDAGKQQIRELAMNSGLSQSAQMAVVNNLDWTGQRNPGLYGMAMSQLSGGMSGLGAFTGTGGDSDLNKSMTAQASSDLKLNGNAAGAAYMLLAANSETDHNRFTSSNKDGRTFQNVANGLINQSNNGIDSSDPGYITPDNKQRLAGVPIIGGLDRAHGTASDINGLLDQLKGGNAGSQALGQELLSQLRTAGLAVDALGHVSGDTTKALAKLQDQAGNVSSSQLATASMVTQMNATRGDQIYQQMTGDPNSTITQLTGNTQALTYGSNINRVNQEFVNDGAAAASGTERSPLFTASNDVGVTSPRYIEGLKNAIVQFQKMKDVIGTPTSNDWKALDAIQQADVSKLSTISSAVQSPAQALRDQADMVGAMTADGVNVNNVDQVQAQKDSLEQQYVAQASVLKSAYMNVVESNRQMAREQADHQHQMDISQRDYNRQVQENWYQYGVSQTEALYQYNWAAQQRQYSFDEEIRSQKYSLANAYGNAGSMVQAQYTQGAQSTMIGMTAQVKQLQDAKDAMAQLKNMGVSDDAVRVLKLDDPTNVSQAKRYINDFANDPSLIKQFNDSIGQRLNLTEAIATAPNNSSFIDLKRQFDKTATDAGDEFAHSQQLSAEAFDHSMQQSALSYQTSMGDFQYNYNLQMSRTREDMSRMNEYISMSADELTAWAKGSGIKGLSDIADAMQAVADRMKATNDQIAAFTNPRSDTPDPLKSGKASYDGSSGHQVWIDNPGVGATATTPGVLAYPSQVYPAGPSYPAQAYPAAPPYATQGTGTVPPVAVAPAASSLYPAPTFGAPSYGSGLPLGTQTTEAKNYKTALDKAHTSIKDFASIQKDSTKTVDDQTTAQHNAETAIVNAVTAAGQKAAADNASKDPATQAAAVVKAQRDTFDELTGKIGGVPGALTNLGTHLHASQDPMNTTSQVASDLKDSINNIPKDPKVTFTANTSDATQKVSGLVGFFQTATTSAIGLLNWLIGGWDYIADHLGMSALDITPFNTPSPSFGGSGKFDRGGYTGDGMRLDPAGVVHKGEFVLTQEKTRKHRPLLEAIHRGDDALLPGYAGGGVVKGADVTWVQLDAIRKSLFPGSVLTSAYRPGTSDYHGRGEAIDIGVAGNLQSGLMPIAAKLAQLYPNSTELIHNPNGSIKNGKVVPSSLWGGPTWASHANHVHWAMTPDALKSGGSGADNSKMSLADALLNPIGYLRDMMGAKVSAFAGGPLGGLAGMPGKMIDHIGDKIGGWISNIGSKIASVAEGAWDTVTGLFGGGSSTQDKVKGVAKGYGWDRGSEWDSLNTLIGAESSWNPTAQNRTSTAYGLFQFLNSTWAGTGIGKTADPAKQAEAGLKYISGRYHDPIGAWNFHKANGWYANGGIFNSAQTIGVGEAGPEVVLPLNAGGANFMAQTLKASVGLMGGDPNLAQTLKAGRTSGYASPARSEMHVHHTDASTNYTGDIHVHASDPTEMGRKLAERARLSALTNPAARR